MGYDERREDAQMASKPTTNDLPRLKRSLPTMFFITACVVIAWQRAAISADNSDHDARPEWETPARLKELNDLEYGRLKPDEVRRAVSDLAPGLDRANRLHGIILGTFRNAARHDPKALEPALPQFAAELRKLNDDRELCEYLDPLIGIERGTPELTATVDGVFKSDQRFDFARPRAAAVLLKIDPRHGDMLDWLERELKGDRPQMRLVAAKMLGYLGTVARLAAPRLRKTLNDSDPAVRVAAAQALWRIEHKSDDIMPTLRRALGESAVGADDWPIYLSEDSGITQKYLAVRCLGDIGKPAAVAADEIARAILPDEKAKRLNEDYSVIQIAGADALSKIGQSSATVISTLRKLNEDSEPAVADHARAALKMLTAAPGVKDETR
jgi:hypothetical protein